MVRATKTRSSSILRQPETKRRRERPIDYEALADFRFQLRRFLAFSEANARKNGLTSQQYQALLTIKGLTGPNSNMSVGELAGFLLVKNHTAVELVGRMSKAGLVNRLTDPTDGRRILVTLTRKGEQRLARVAEVNWRELRSHRLALPRILESFR